MGGETNQAVEVVNDGNGNNFSPTPGGGTLAQRNGTAADAPQSAPSATPAAALVTPGNLGSGNFYGCVYRNCGYQQGRRRLLAALGGLIGSA